MKVKQNFFALTKDENGACQVKRIRVNQPLQEELTQIFDNQSLAFEKDIDTEIIFNGDWKPDNNEILVIENLSESNMMSNAINSNASSFPALVISSFPKEPIKAIFTGLKKNGETKILVQKFTSRQALSLSSLPIIKMQTGNTFTKATDDIFTIDNKLVAIIEGNRTKFKSFHNARTVFDLSNHYKEATDDDLEEISQHASLDVGDLQNFINEADTQVRKMVHTIKSSALLDNYTVNQISSAAALFSDLPITVANGKIILPKDKKSLKEVLHFLLEDIYKGPLSGGDFLTNSKRAL